MKSKIPLTEAQKLVNQVIDWLSPDCERIEPAGSVRRLQPEVGDLEIVCIPKRALNLFGEPGESLLDYKLIQLVNDGYLLSCGVAGDKYKKFILYPAGVQLDLFITTPEQWGVIFTIRTGSADFSHRLVTPKSQGGLLPGGLKIAGGHLLNTWKNESIATPEERDFFAAIGLDWIEPKDRD